MNSPSRLKDVIQTCPLVDNHCHNVVSINSGMECFLSESSGKASHYIPSTVSFKRSIREISELLEAENNIESVKEKREEMGIVKVTKVSFDAANVSAILVDDGLSLKGMFDLEWHKNVVKPVFRVLRIETLAQELLETHKPSGRRWSLEEFEKKFMSAIDPPPKDVISFKSIAAYRCGLQILTSFTTEEVKNGLQKDLESSPLKLRSLHFLSFLFIKSLEVATKYNIPCQIHTGFGDNDLNLLDVNPLHLRNILEDPRFENSKLVLLHCSYPYCREAGYLASVYSQVFLDFGLVFPKITFHGMKSTLHQLLELTPMKKLLYSSDAVGLPELYYLGAKCARRALYEVLETLCADGDLSYQEAEASAVDMLFNNANELYGLGLEQIETSKLLSKNRKIEEEESGS